MASINASEFAGSDAVISASTVASSPDRLPAAMKLYSFLHSLRPWSFPVTVSAIAVGAALASHTHSFSFVSFILALIGGLAVHAFGNIINTYFDFISGVDRPDNQADDRAIVDGIVTQNEVKGIAAVCLIISMIATILIGQRLWFLEVDKTVTFTPLTSFLLLVLVGGFLAYSYTGWPLQLKYHRLGDIVIFLCFGPLLTTGAYFVQTATLSLDAIILSIPLGLLTEGILHANNARDIEIDLAAGAHTVANTIGFAKSEKLFHVFYLLSFTMLPLFAWRYHSLAYLMPMLMLVQLRDLFDAFRSHNPALKVLINKKTDGDQLVNPVVPVADICDRCGKFSAGFGILLALAIVFS